MNHDLRVAICHSITARAHLAGAEAAELKEAHAIAYDCGEADPSCSLLHLAAAARRRYWREVAAVQRLIGHPWPGAEALGVEP